MENKKEETIIEPGKYFEMLKEKKHQNTDETLNKFYDTCFLLLEKYKRTQQFSSMKKLMFVINCVSKERELIKLGLDIFIYKDDIEEYINSVEKKVIKIIELKNYTREIPDELISVIEKTRDIFNNNFYVLFTDYTGKIERTVQKERRKKDPILFGVFAEGIEVNDRFYYLGDWEDEYCDLTLEKLIEEKGSSIVKTIGTPTDKDELLAECSKLIEEKHGFRSNSNINYSSSSPFTTSNTIITVKETKKPVKRKWFSKVRFFVNKEDDN